MQADPTRQQRTVSRRRVLLSAFACAPDWGSEPGVGWHWAIELARRHDVTVITHERFRSRIEAEVARNPQPAIVFRFFGRPGDEARMQRQVDSRLHYWRWQLGLRRQVRRLLQQQRHDLIHHLTWGSFKLPSFLGGLGVPFVLGPVGGGEIAPARLLGPWPWRERAFYRLRSVSVALSRHDPFVTQTLRSACCTLVKTEQTRRALPSFAREHAILALETGVEADSIVAARPFAADARRPLRLLYAGRLLGGKGAGYAVEAVLSARRDGSRVELVLAGTGGIEASLRRQVLANGAEGVRFLGWQPHSAMAALYDASDLLVFPSWHDSSGNVVTEALARGLPVLCLDLGGPGHAVDARCGVVVPTAGFDAAGLSRVLAKEIVALASDRERLHRLSVGALERARELTWSSQVDRVYSLIESRLGWSAGGPARGAR